MRALTEAVTFVGFFWQAMGKAVCGELTYTENNHLASFDVSIICQRPDYCCVDPL